MNIASSISEDRGIEILNRDDLLVYSVGVSTGGLAEIKMAQKNPKLRIIATTIDSDGAMSARKNILEKKLGDQVEIKIEDISRPLEYNDGFFDYIYARLILHYLPEKELTSALKEMYRILRIGGKIYVVVRSTECYQATQGGSEYNADSHLTSYDETNDQGGRFKVSRFFHTEESIRQYLSQAGFQVELIEKYNERLYKDFMRTKPSPYVDKLIGVVASKVS